MQPRKERCQWHDCAVVMDLGSDPFDPTNIMNLPSGSKGIALVTSDGSYKIKFWCNRHLEDYENKHEAIIRAWEKENYDVDQL